MKYFAHTGLDENQDDWQLLREHLVNVSSIAGEMMKLAIRNTVLEKWSVTAGMLHDLGKYRMEFQQMLLGLNPPREKTYHKQAGAAKSSTLKNVPVAFAIAGHHGGIPNKAELESAIWSENGLAVANNVWTIAESEIPELSKLTPVSPQISAQILKNELHADLITRIIFSCLVDADWKDTGRYDRNVRCLPPEPFPAEFNGELWLTRLLRTLDAKSKSCRETHVKQARRDVLDACIQAAENPQGVFSLTVPTGGGKTLAGFAFALKHAIRHGLRRIIYVAPYLTILEQNEDAIRSALGFDAEDTEIFVHHSLADPAGTDAQQSTERDATARRAENWDAPIIITTSVQFYESLFSNKPSRCRKLHNIARSVVILDECQTLPPELAAPTCSMLRQLAEECSATILLCTATQPAFDHDELKADERLRSREIVPSSLLLSERLKRVDIHWPKSHDEAIDWPELARQMLGVAAESNRTTGVGAIPGTRALTQSLCIVNSRRAAREVFDELQKLTADGVFHLSTSMCPQHRTEVLKEVRRRLREDLPCQLVSTQLIEAGVDVDFPVVFRELSPLESIVQAAGRCNREGSLRNESGLTTGRVVVFRSQKSIDEPRKYFPQDSWYRAGKSTLENHFLNTGKRPQIDNPEDIREYFTRLYHSGSLDQHRIQDSRRNFNFPEVAANYKLIDQDGIAAVVATWDPYRDQVERLLKTVCHDPSRANFRALARYQINLRYYELRTVGDSVVPLSVKIDMPIWYGRYDNDLGLNTDATDALLMI